jgi:hypothetical protein
VGEELENIVTTMNEPPENQEDGGGEMQLANVALRKGYTVDSRITQKVPKEMDRQVFLYCIMGLAHFVLFARRQSIVLNEQI